MAKGCQCKKAAECEECAEWIFTFADLVMLMMGFFVILWVLKPSPSKENPQANADWIKVAAAIREAFDYIPDPQSKDPVDVEMLMEKLQKLKLDGPATAARPTSDPTARKAPTRKSPASATALPPQRVVSSSSHPDHPRSPMTSSRS